MSDAGVNMLCIGGPIGGQQYAVDKPNPGDTLNLRENRCGQIIHHIYILKPDPVVVGIHREPLLQWHYIGEEPGEDIQ